MTSTQTPHRNDWRVPGSPGADGPTVVIPRWAPPSPPAGGDGKKWALIAGGTVAVVAVTVTTLALTVGGGPQAGTPVSSGTTTVAPTTPVVPTTPSAQPRATAVDPEDVLLTPAELDRLFGDTYVEKGRDHRLQDSSRQIDRGECLSSYAPVERRSYAGSGYTRVAATVAKAERRMTVFQGAVGFPSADDAEEYVRSALASWNACANTVVRVEAGAGEPPLPLVFEPVGTTSRGLHTQVQRPEDPARVASCERALGADGAVVIDVLVCSANARSEGAEVAAAMVRKAQRS